VPLLSLVSLTGFLIVLKHYAINRLYVFSPKKAIEVKKIKVTFLVQNQVASCIIPPALEGTTTLSIYPRRCAGQEWRG
jgi:hypothetical protein